PCYAAPELVISDGYVGEAADIWSCGVILYAMLCGYLPFDDDPDNPDGDNINLLYKYILETELDFPDYVSADARSLLMRMLVPDPKYRAKMPEVMSHRWLAPAAYIFEEEMIRRQRMAMMQAVTTPPESPIPDDDEMMEDEDDGMDYEVHHQHQQEQQQQQQIPVEQKVNGQQPEPQHPITPESDDVQDESQVDVEVVTAAMDTVGVSPTADSAVVPMDLTTSSSFPTSVMTAPEPATTLTPPPESVYHQEKVDNIPSSPISATQSIPQHQQSSSPARTSTSAPNSPRPSAGTFTPPPPPPIPESLASASASAATSPVKTTPPATNGATRLVHSRSASEAATIMASVSDGNVSPTRKSETAGRRRASKSSTGNGRNSRASVAGGEEGGDSGKGENGGKDLKHSSSFKQSSTFLTWFKRKPAGVPSPSESSDEHPPAVQATATSPTTHRHSIALSTSDTMRTESGSIYSQNVEIWPLMPPPRYPVTPRSQSRTRRPMSTVDGNSSHDGASIYTVNTIAGNQSVLVVPTQPTPPISSLFLSNGGTAVVGTTSTSAMDTPGRPSMQAPSLSASDYHLHLESGKPRKLKYHSGPIDQRALTSRDPAQLLIDLENFFLDRGFDVLSNGLESGEFKLKLLRPRTGGVLVAGNSSASNGGVYDVNDDTFMTVNSLENLPGIEKFGNLNIGSPTLSSGSVLPSSSSSSASASRISMAIGEDPANARFRHVDLGRPSVDVARAAAVSSSGSGNAANFKDRKRKAKGAAKLAMVIASLPISLVKRLKYLATHGPNYNKGFDGRTSVDVPVPAGAAGSVGNGVVASSSASMVSGISSGNEVVTNGSSSGGSSTNVDKEANGDAATSTTAVTPTPTAMTTQVIYEPVVDEIKFNVEIEKIKNLQGLHVVDFKRLRGDIWAFKKMYHVLISEMPLKQE
ncbi:hypothetical protein HDU76_006374, partial [Blyttiomyces sp. JEL0837]